jgi:Protein of unknown function (DUF3891)
MFLHQLESGSTFVVLQDYHLVLAGQFAATWGNDDFDPADPASKYMARNHDAGWVEHDREPGKDPSTGLPWHIVDMLPEDLNPIHRRSIDRNSAFDRYTGILSCMHTMGFYNGRMGQSDFTVMDDYADSHSEEIHPMVEECTNRIDGWKSELIVEGADPDELEADIWRSYRRLEVFDTLSIHFGLQPAAEMKLQTFPNAPMRGDELTSISLTPQDDGRILVDPYPFSKDPLTVYLNGRVLDGPPSGSAGEALADAPAVEVEYTLCAA